MNILVTGTSRGIGAAIAASLSGHQVVGHSTTAGEGRIAADLSRPGAAEALWAEALARLLPTRDRLLGPQRQRADEAGARLDRALERRVTLERGTLDRSGGALRPALAFGLLLGVNLGPLLTVTGSLATMLCLSGARRAGVRVPALAFVGAGLLVTPPMLLAAGLTLALLLRP